VAQMAALEMDVSQIRREGDYRHFIENSEEVWHVSVCEGDGGRLDGFLASCSHPGCTMIGPGVMRDEATAVSLLAAELDRMRGQSPVFLVPVEWSGLVAQAYAWGARNCEMHVSQVCGDFVPFRGINMPSFMPETG
jgi:hypothetical protein